MIYLLNNSFPTNFTCLPDIQFHIKTASQIHTLFHGDHMSWSRISNCRKHITGYEHFGNWFIILFSGF